MMDDGKKLGRRSAKITFTTFNSDSVFDRMFDKQIQIKRSVSVCATVNTNSQTSERADEQELYCSEASVGFCSPVGGQASGGG